QLGPQQLGHKQGEVFLGRDYGHQANYSNEVAARIDAEVRHLITAAHSQARDILVTHREVLDRLASALIEKETLDTPELMEIFGELAPWSVPAVTDAVAQPEPAAEEEAAAEDSKRERRRAPRPSAKPATA
ncbi:MAG TPA: hypothetical protein VHE80_00705, partial [Acidimicrobiales bacterium]|nr:hypothetical protein [Acidimicrobiales bacterium]